MCVCVRARARVCKRACVCVCMYVYVCVCVRARTCRVCCPSVFVSVCLSNSQENNSKAQNIKRNIASVQPLTDVSKFFFVFKNIFFFVVHLWANRIDKSSALSLDRLGRRGDMRDDSAGTLFQSFLQEALMSSSGMGRKFHSLMLSIQHFLCRPRRYPPSKVPWMMGFERLSWRVTRPNHASFRLLTVARRGSCGPTRKLILLHTQLLVLCSK